MERTEEVVAIATSHRVLETMSSQFAITFKRTSHKLWPVYLVQNQIVWTCRIRWDYTTLMCSKMEYVLYCYLGKHKWEGRNRPLKKAVVSKFATTSVRYYADFAYYFGCQFIFYLYEIILKYIPWIRCLKSIKNTHTLLQMCKKMRDLAGFV